MPAPFSVSVVADSAVEASWLITPVVDSVSAPVVVTAPSVLVVRLLVRLSVPVFAVTLPMSLPALSSVYVPTPPSRLTVVALKVPGCVTVPPVVNVNAPVVATLSKLVVTAMFFRSMLAALPVPPVVSDVNLLSSVPSVNVPPPLSVNAPAVNAAVWIAVPAVVSVSAPPRVLTAPPSAIPPEPPMIATPNASDIVDPIEPVNPAIELIDTDLSAALASANDAVCVPVRLIAAFTNTLPPVDSSFDMPSPTLTPSTTARSPTLETFSVVAVVTGPTFSDTVLAFNRLIVPVLPVSVPIMLPLPVNI